jgi:hypothetical protein
MCYLVIHHSEHAVGRIEFPEFLLDHDNCAYSGIARLAAPLL